VDDNKKLKDINPGRAAVEAVWSGESCRRIKRLIREARPEVAHFHNTFLRISPAAYYACKEEGVPVVQTLHNYRLICPGALIMRDGKVCEDCVGKGLPWTGVVHGCWRGSRVQTAVVAAMLSIHRWVRTWQKKVNLYIALTKFSRSKFIEGGLPPEKIVVKPNFVDPDPGVREDQGGYVLFVGRLSPEKGIQTMLKAGSKLKRIALKILGNGPLMDEIQRTVCNNGLDMLEILGQRPRREVFEFMKGARLIVFPSEWYEGFPVTIAEAFACGVPVIASRLGAMAEIIEDKRTGLHFDPGNPEDLAAKVEWAWNHPKEMQEMGYQARKEYEAKYTAERNYKLLMEIYEKAIHSN